MGLKLAEISAFLDEKMLWKDSWGPEMAFFIELEGKKEGIIVQKISIFMKLVEKIAQNCQLTDQNSLWNTEKYK